MAARTSRRLVDKGHLSLVYAPSLLRRLVLDGPLATMWSDGYVSVGDLWETFARYPYLPRLRDRSVLDRCVQDGPSGFSWGEEGFAVADGYDDQDRRYLGVVVGPASAGPVSASTLLVQPAIALAQVRSEEQAAQATSTETSSAGDATSNMGDAPPRSTTGTPAETNPRRFHGSVRLRSDRLSLEFGRVVQEVISHLGDSAQDVEVTVEIAATSPEGFDEAVIRTVTENARTLRFGDQGFEHE